MSDTSFVVFPIGGSEKMNIETVEDLQKMLGKKFKVEYKIVNEIPLVTIKKLE